MTGISPTVWLDSVLRVVRPQAGALANAGDAVRAGRLSAGERRDSSLMLAQASGPSAWAPLEQPVSPVRAGTGHAVVVYLDDADLVGQLASYVADGVVAGEVCLVVATAAHLAGLHQRLAVAGLADIATSPLLVELDADETLQSFLRGGWPDPDLFEAAVGQAVRARLREGRPVRAFGEMVGLLTEQDNLPAALQLEKLWDALHLQHRFALLCAYPASAAARQDDDDLCRIYARHTHLAGAGS